MKKFYLEIGFIAGFLILIIILKASFGKAWADRFLIIVLLSMLLINHQKISTFLKEKFG